MWDRVDLDKARAEVTESLRRCRRAVGPRHMDRVRVYLRGACDQSARRWAQRVQTGQENVSRRSTARRRDALGRGQKDGWRTSRFGFGSGAGAPLPDRSTRPLGASRHPTANRTAARCRPTAKIEARKVPSFQQHGRWYRGTGREIPAVCPHAAYTLPPTQRVAWGRPPVLSRPSSSSTMVMQD